jgi:hypothetical protein
VEPGDAPDAVKKDGTILLKGKDITVGGSSGGTDSGAARDVDAAHAKGREAG